MKGSGMGLICSGEVSDTCFFSMAEKNFALHPNVIKKFGILYYGRFKDDGIVIMSSPMEVRMLFMRLLKVRAAFFDIKVESVSARKCVMLDVCLYKGEGWKHSGSLVRFVKAKNQRLEQNFPQVLV